MVTSLCSLCDTGLVPTECACPGGAGGESRTSRFGEWPLLGGEWSVQAVSGAGLA